MAAYLQKQSYGKHSVRVSKIKRARLQAAKSEVHELVEYSVDIELDGDFQAAYTQHDNRLVIATDTCRNTVYVLAKENPMHSLEEFGIAIVQHFLTKYSHVQIVKVQLREHLWHRCLQSPYSFLGSDLESPTGVILGQRNQEFVVRSGIQGLSIAKTTESGFLDFHFDQYRTLPDTHDRIMATILQADWRYATLPTNFSDTRKLVRDKLLTKFIDHYSHSVQETLYRMAQGALDGSPEIESITLTMPNKHHLRFDLSPFGLTNDNEVFVVTDEPFGYIHATVARDSS